MSAALRLWWLLRSTSQRPRDLAVAASFGLVAWALLAATGLVQLARHSTDLNRSLLGALVVLVLALALTAVIAVRSLLQRDQDRRLEVLRSAGASRLQTTLVCTLEVLDSALPGVVVGVLAHLALCWAVAFGGADLTPTAAAMLVPFALFALALAGVVVWRVRSATRS
ncbi:FtsX-like permease family protein [Mobilicoccus caccae]|uniref:FtsX-like permease family protein n=1 Tax=Mobilicoccus caccae TaxID=1859295 RepID=A0ABQ6IQA4_9MICO|nr:FtsX-like permease family protein [Mobilicoccus caccae]GMA40085.1 hypothetical protein GCM10025883_21300 [Mobilicoccus caccae]